VSVFNRLLAILLALVLLVAGGAALLTALRVAQPAQIAPTPWFADRLVPFTQLDPTLWNWTVGVSLGLILVALLLLFVELRPAKRAASRITLKQDGLGRVTVALDGVRDLVDREAGRVAGVKGVRSRVDETPAGIQLLCNITVDPASSVPELTHELQQRLKAAVEHHLGLPVSQVSVDARVAPLVIDRRPRRVQ
jgi:divalent metal cation (Fe/Co/Zn/Cd) transporter